MEHPMNDFHGWRLSPSINPISQSKLKQLITAKIVPEPFQLLSQENDQSQYNSTSSQINISSQPQKPQMSRKQLNLAKNKDLRKTFQNSDQAKFSKLVAQQSADYALKKHFQDDEFSLYPNQIEQNNEFNDSDRLSLYQITNFKLDNTNEIIENNALFLSDNEDENNATQKVQEEVNVESEICNDKDKLLDDNDKLYIATEPHYNTHLLKVTVSLDPIDQFEASEEMSEELAKKKNRKRKRNFKTKYLEETNDSEEEENTAEIRYNELLKPHHNKYAQSFYGDETTSYDKLLLQKQKSFETNSNSDSENAVTSFYNRLDSSTTLDINLNNDSIREAMLKPQHQFKIKIMKTKEMKCDSDSEKSTKFRKAIFQSTFQQKLTTAKATKYSKCAAIIPDIIDFNNSMIKQARTERLNKILSQKLWSPEYNNTIEFKEIMAYTKCYIDYRFSDNIFFDMLSKEFNGSLENMYNIHRTRQFVKLVQKKFF